MYVRKWKLIGAVEIADVLRSGKSHLAQGIAREINCSFYRVSSSDLISS